MSSVTIGGPPDHDDALDTEPDLKANLHAATVQSNVVNDQKTRNSTVDGEDSASVASEARGNQCSM